MDLKIARRSFSPVLSLVLVTAGLAVLYYATARPALLRFNGESQQLRTHARRPADLLLEAGIVLGPNDALVPGNDTQLNWDGGRLPVVEFNQARPVVIVDQSSIEVVESSETSPANLIDNQLFPGDRLVVNGLPLRSDIPTHIRLRRAVPIRLQADGRELLLHSAASTLGEALWENGIYLYEGDRLDPLPDTPVDGPIQAQLHRSIPLSIRIGGQEIRGRSAAETVGAGLNDVGLQLAGLDYAIPDTSQPIPSDGQIQLVRVREQVQMEQQPLSFDTIYQPLDSLKIDNQQIVQPGAYGVITNRIRVRSEDGVEVGRTLEGEWIAQDPTSQIIGYGTQIQIQSVATADGPLDYWRAVDMYATSYSPSRAGVSADARNFGITASGKRLVKGLVAIDRSLIPFGTMMYVPGYGYAEAADTGGGVKGRWIDLGYEDDNWVSWSGTVTVYFLTPVPTSIVYVFP